MTTWGENRDLRCLEAAEASGCSGRRHHVSDERVHAGAGGR